MAKALEQHLTIFLVFVSLCHRPLARCYLPIWSGSFCLRLVRSVSLRIVSTCRGTAPKGLLGVGRPGKKIGLPRTFRAHFAYRDAQTLTGLRFVFCSPGFDPQRAHYFAVVFCAQILVLYGVVV